MKQAKTKSRHRRGGKQHIEHDMQAAFFRWLDYAASRDDRARALGTPSLFTEPFHVPNGGQRTALAGARMKELGVKPGVPDVLCPFASNGYIGLAIEFKAPGGRLSEAQKYRLSRLASHRWDIRICRDWAEAAQIFLMYCGCDEHHFLETYAPYRFKLAAKKERKLAKTS